jgi:hypothetical protein
MVYSIRLYVRLRGFQRTPVVMGCASMEQLRNLSSRPTLLRDGNFVTDPSGAQIGTPGALGRHRVVAALPMAPVEIQRRVLVHDGGGAYLADPAGNVLGTDRIIVHRMLAARWVEDTRRLAGG